MAKFIGPPFCEIRLDKDGKRLNADQPLRPDGVTDLIVISHGWHQDAGGGSDSAQAMYEAMIGHVKGEAEALGLFPDRTFGVVAVYWPSDQFRPDLGQETLPPGLDPASVAADFAERDVTVAELRAQARDLAKMLGLDPHELELQAAHASSGGVDADVLVDTLRTAVMGGDVSSDLAEEHAELLSARSGGDMFDDLREAGAANADIGEGVTGGGAAFDLDPAAGEDTVQPAVHLLSGPFAAVAKILNQFAYFELKKRAGVMGKAVARELDADGTPGVARLHLIGHSFGARLVTSAAQAIKGQKPYSMTLVQGAFSHNAFGVDVGDKHLDGAFRDVLTGAKVKGRIVATHTWNDEAVGVAYAVASRASRDIASGFVKVSDGFGGAKDVNGGIGANGALRLKDGEGVRLVYDGVAPPTLASGKFHSLKCDFIGSHTDIRRVEVARVILAATA